MMEICLSDTPMSVSDWFRPMSPIPKKTPVTFQLHDSTSSGASKEEYATTLENTVDRAFLFLPEIHLHLLPEAQIKIMATRKTGANP
jgi:hypothetical protein